MLSKKKLNEQKHYLFGIDDVAAAMIIGGLVSAAASAYNVNSQKETNEKNLNYNEGLTREQWARDERAIQTQVADAEKAGLSPLAVVNGGGATVSQAIPANMQSPNLDATGILSMMSTAVQEKTKRQATESTAKNIKNQIKTNAEIAEKTLKKDYDIAGIQDETNKEKIKADLSKAQAELKQLAESLKVNTQTQKLIEVQQTHARAAETELNNFAKNFGVSIPSKTVTINSKSDYQNWKIHQSRVLKAIAEAINRAEIKPESQSDSSMTSINGGINGNAQIMGTGGGGGVNGSYTGSESHSVTRNSINAQTLSREIAAALRGAMYEIPIFYWYPEK